MGRRPAGRKAPAGALEVTIRALGDQGDGIAEAGGRRLYVPFTLPGDRVRVRTVGPGRDGERGEVVAWLHRASRAEPPCPHFGTCGGCRLQHLAADRYRAFKTDALRHALARRGLGEVPLRPLLGTPPGARRRLRLAFEGEGRGLRLGLRAARSARVVDLVVCPIAAPEIVQAFTPLRTMLARWRTSPGEIGVTFTDAGLDLLFIRTDPPGLGEREDLAALAQDLNAARVSWSVDAREPPEPVVARRPVQVSFGGLVVDLPAGAFVQASTPAEDHLAHLVREAVGQPAAVADLFAGCGTFGLPLAAAGARLHAFETSETMLDALLAAARRAGLAARVGATPRDLMRAPLEPADLGAFEAAILDPPRAGASAQAAALAASRVPRIAMVSCNPRTFARDARLLVDGGYQVVFVQPVDAFLWSPEIEVVGAFARS